jgi:hypothetical protein
MMKKVLLAVFLLLVPVVSASSTQQFNNIRLNPYYYSSLTANTNQTMTVSVNPSDNIASVTSAIIHFKTFTSGSTTTYILYVNGKLCGTFLVNTAFANSGQNEVAFDCTSLITKAGVYTLNFKSSVNSGAGFGWLDLTYVNNPITLDVKGTEYTVNDNALIFARLLDGNSKPVNLGSCNATIYYPNNTKLYNKQPLTFLEDGIYYFDFTTPDVIGNYITTFDCVFPANVFYQNRTINFGIGAGTPEYQTDFNFDDSNNVTINSARLLVSVTGTGIGAINNYYFNGQLIQQLTGVIQLLNVSLNQSNFVSGETQELAVVRQALSSTVVWASLNINYTYNNPLTTIRGQNEIHIGNWSGMLNSTLDAQLNHTNSLILNTNSTVNNRLDSIWDFLVSLKNDLNLWIYGNRTVVNITNVSYVLNISSFNITNATVLNQTVNVTVENKSVEVVNQTVNVSVVNQTVNVTNVVVNVNNVTVQTSIVNITNQSVDLTNVTEAIASVNETVKSEGFNIISLINYWGNALESKIDSMLLGNVTVTAAVDYDRIALTVMEYLKALQKQELI